jgi:hypothetical protein
MAFFRQFPKTQYDFFNRGVNYNITDMFRYVNVDYSFLDDVATYSYYRIQNGERPDIVSQRLYGTPDYYWTFFIVNDHLKTGLAGWPLPQELFEDYMNTEYSGVAVNSKVNLGINAAGEVLYTNALADEFPIGTRVTIASAGPPAPITGIPTTIIRGSGTVYARNPQSCQLIIRDIEEFVTNPFVEEGFIQSTNDSLTIRSFSPYRDAIKYYIDTTTGLESYNPFFFDPTELDNPEFLNLQGVTYYEYESDLNDKRSDIRIVRPSLIYKFANQFSKLINAN